MLNKFKQQFTPKEYIAIFLFAFVSLYGFYSIFAWMSYSPIDSAWSVSSSEKSVLNKTGVLGAWSIDLFLTLFGYLGNLFPVILFLAPIHLIHTKLTDSLTLLRFNLRMLGLMLFVYGMITLSAILLPNQENYLAGGVLGGMAAQFLVTLIGKFGTLLLCLFLVTIGVILFSGKSLVVLAMSFYHWITTEQNAFDDLAEDSEDFADSISESAVENGQVFASHYQNVRTQQTTTSINANKPSIFGLNESSMPMHNNIDNSGFNQLSTASSFDDALYVDNNDNKEIFTGYNTTTVEHLPTVMLEGLNDEFNQPATRNVSSTPLEDEPLYITTVSLTDPSPAVMKVNRVQTVMADTVPTVTAMAQPQRALNTERVEPVQPVASKQVEEDIAISVPIEQPKAMGTPNYKSYTNTLVHPLLQQPVSRKEKPTTPLPTLDLLEEYQNRTPRITEKQILETSERIEQQLRNFNVKATVQDVLIGPVVTRYDIELQPGVKASKVSSIDTDLARALMFRSIRVTESIPGKPYIGIETPNEHRQVVSLRSVLDSEEFQHSSSLLSMALGKDISGKPVVVDLAKMPHLLVAGSTGSGKSVGVNTMILSLLFKVRPDQVKFIMIDPKVVELSIYNDIPHLLTPVVTDMKKAANALRWCVDEMERRYLLLSALRVRNIDGYNEKIDEAAAMNLPIPNPIWKPGDTMDSLPPALEKLSYIVVIVDEFADLMMVAGKQIEELIARLAQKARAIGIHLILATQRPSVDVITGLIKANIPSRIAFTVASKIDSRTILDQGGAEALLGRGDMLYSGQGSSELIRVHGAFMSDGEVARITDDWRARGRPEYINAILESVDDETDNAERDSTDSGDVDPLFDEVVEYVTSVGNVSASSIQRRFKVGFNRAARIVEQMEEQGIVSEPGSNGRRELLVRHTDY